MSDPIVLTYWNLLALVGLLWFVEHQRARERKALRQRVEWLEKNMRELRGGGDE